MYGCPVKPGMTKSGMIRSENGNVGKYFIICEFFNFFN
jgi:hypothetical protein